MGKCACNYYIITKQVCMFFLVHVMKLEESKKIERKKKIEELKEERKKEK